jgi:hypothetical protein
MQPLDSKIIAIDNYDIIQSKKKRPREKEEKKEKKGPPHFNLYG